MNKHAIQYTLRAAQLLLQVHDCIKGAESEGDLSIDMDQLIEEVWAAGGCTTIQNTTKFLNRQAGK